MAYNDDSQHIKEMQAFREAMKTLDAHRRARWAREEADRKPNKNK